MKLRQFRQVLDAAAELYRDSGDVAAAEALHDIARAFDGYDTMTVQSFSRRVAKIATADFEATPEPPARPTAGRKLDPVAP